MDEQSVTMVAPRLMLDEDLLPEAVYAFKVPYLNHGRHITRNRQGLWIGEFVFDRRFTDRNWLALAIAKKPDSEGSDFHPVLLLLGHTDRWHQPVLECGPGFILNSCVVMDAQDTLHVLYEQEGGIYLRTADASGADPHAALSQASAWSAEQAIAPAGSSLGDALRLPSGEIAVYFMRGGMLYEKLLGGAESPIVANAVHPSVYVEASGLRHLAFERDRRVFYLRSSDGANWTDTKGSRAPEMVAYFCSSYPSIAATPQGKVVIAWQGEGKVDLKRDPDVYGRLRWIGGCTVSYATLEAGHWTIRDFLRSSEIILKRKPCSSAISTRYEKFVPFMEEFWRPSLAVDKHGVIWMFYSNTTRRHVYFARFEGERFGEHYEARGAYDCMSRVMFLQKDSLGQSAIGMLTLAANHMYFDKVEVPDYASSESRRVVFLDNLEVDELVGLEQHIGGWKKHAEPVFGAGISGTALEDEVAWCTVRKVPGGLEMKYLAFGSLYHPDMHGRAFSKDGIHWEKRPPVDDKLLTLDGKPCSVFSNFSRPIWIEDPTEKDPARRYKGLLGAWFDVRDIETRIYHVVVSPDERNWSTVPGLKPVVLGDWPVSHQFIRDDEDKDPRRRFKVAMLQGSASGRAICVFTSPDAIHWERVYNLRENPDILDSPLSPFQTGPIAIDPDAGESPWEEEVHDANIWREHGLLMFHYDAFYFGHNQHINKALAVSRDGKHYRRVQRGAHVMPHGNCGEWDNGRVRTCPPVRVGDEMRLYFVGMPAGQFADPDKDDPSQVKVKGSGPLEVRLQRELRPWKVSFATMRPEGWAFIQMEREAQTGRLTTIPFEYAGGRLVVNGSGLGEGGIRVEILQAAGGAVVPGYDKAHCRFSAADSISSAITWPGCKPLAKGRYRLRFVFDGLRAKLYSFGFEPEAAR